ncbi:MAG: tetratricopeptide repeat protein [Deltaproteobacteria bacterium]|nr:tetratricopeptide repeat protein [Deltaproteobacteria bacterium]
MRAALVAVAFVAACGAPARPVEPAKATVDVKAEVDLAEAAERTRRHDVARAHFQKAVAAARDPSSIAYARWRFAETLVSWGELPEARAQLEAAVQARPDHPIAWHDLGHVRFGSDDYPGAIAAFQKARDLAPRELKPRLSLAVTLWKHGDLAAASNEYRALLELDLPDRTRGKVEWAIAELAKLQKR